jgi:hypothetical protein
MDDANFFKWLFGAFLTIWLFLTRWTHHRVSQAHTRIDKEREINDAKVNLIYAKIDESIAKTEKCRNEIKKDLDVRMTEPHIKEYVGMSIVPLANDIKSTNEKLDVVLVDLKSILERTHK